VGKVVSIRLPIGRPRGCSPIFPDQGQQGFRVVDVWESEEAFRRFGETLMPILQELGVEGEPEIYATHTFVSA
jgi:hypothetical protein